MTTARVHQLEDGLFLLAFNMLKLSITSLHVMRSDDFPAKLLLITVGYRTSDDPYKLGIVLIEIAVREV